MAGSSSDPPRKHVHYGKRICLPMFTSQSRGTRVSGKSFILLGYPVGTLTHTTVNPLGMTCHLFSRCEAASFCTARYANRDDLIVSLTTKTGAGDVVRGAAISDRMDHRSTHDTCRYSEECFPAVNQTATTWNPT